MYVHMEYMYPDVSIDSLDAKDSTRISGTNIPLVRDRVISSLKALILSVIRKARAEHRYRRSQFQRQAILWKINHRVNASVRELLYPITG